MSELDGALLLLNLLTCGVTGVFAMVAVTHVRARVPRNLPRKRRRGSYVPLGQRGGTPLSKGAEPYSEQTPPTVPPSGPAATSPPAAHRHEYVIRDKYPSAECLCGDVVWVKFVEPGHVHSYRYTPGRPIAQCACGSATWQGK